MSTPITPPRREHVLIVAHSDGMIECYAERHIDARIVLMPYVDGSPAGEIAAERYIEHTMPDVYRRLYWPGNIRTRAMIETIRPSDLAQRQWDVALCRSLERAAEILHSTREEAIVWTL